MFIEITWIYIGQVGQHLFTYFGCAGFSLQCVAFLQMPYWGFSSCRAQALECESSLAESHRLR